MQVRSASAIATIIIVVTLLIASITLVVNVPAAQAAATTGTLTVTSNTVLTADHYGGIIVAADNVTLDGNGHTVTGRGTGNGVYLYSRIGVTIKNLRVSNFTYGIQLDHTNNSIITSNTAFNNRGIGIYLFNNSVGNLVSSNNASWNGDFGIRLLYSSNNNTLKNNAASNNKWGGIIVSLSNYVSMINNNASNNRVKGFEIIADGYAYNTLIGNTASSNGGTGIDILAHKSVLTNNTVSNNGGYGIYLYSDWNTVSGNTIMNTGDYGLFVNYGNGYNTIYHNNFISKSKLAFDYDSNPGDVFYLPWPIGGNYWSNYNTPKQGCYNTAPADGFCDTPYTFGNNIKDNLPWISMNGWTNKSLTTPPTTTINITKVTTTHINRTVTTTVSTNISASTITLSTTFTSATTTTTTTSFMERAAAELSIIYSWAVGATAFAVILAIVLLLRRKQGNL